MVQKNTDSKTHELPYLLYDLIVIGAGSGGLNTAAFMNKAGFKVLLIDKTDKNIGGDCLNTGCIPSKALLYAAKTINSAKKAKAFGIQTSGKPNLKAALSYVVKQQDLIREHENAAWFRNLGMDVVLGEAIFVNKNTVSVNGTSYSSRRILLATGTKPRMLDTKGIELAKPLTNETVFLLKETPKNFVIIGGGAIGCELSQAFARFGSKVTLIQRSERLLPNEDPVMSEAMLELLKKEGVEVLLNTEPKEFTKNTLTIRTSSNSSNLPNSSNPSSSLDSSKKSKEKTLRFDKVLVAAGRIPNLNLNLESAGIKTHNGRLVLNERLQTTNKNVFAAGDIANGPMFTHTAEVHAGILIRNFFSPIKQKVSYDKFAWVTYTDPELATFGLSQHELEKRNILFERIDIDHAEDDRTIVESGAGKSILFVGLKGEQKGKILGGSILADSAGEIAQELILAMTRNLSLNALLNKVYPYPTRSRVNKRIVGVHLGKQLTPKVTKLFRFLYRLLP